MRALLLVLLLLMVPVAQAGLGPYEDGWPINVDGQSTAPQNRVGPVTLYPYYPILTAEVQRLALENPDVVRLSSAGQSTIGLELWIMEIADFANPDALPMEEREVVWVDGGTHSNEYSGVYFSLAMAQYLIEGYGSDELATWIVENRQTWILPMVNPDGSNAFGRLNANLVNINRNYPVVWDGQGHDELMNNRGPSPASEVETQIQIEWMNKTSPDYYASVHCCGTMWLYPYGEEGVDPPTNDYTVYETICDIAMPDVRDRCGPIWSTIYPASGSSVDTAYEYTGAVSFGYEMSGRGAVAIWGQPVTTEPVAEQEWESWNGLLSAFENVHLYGGYPVVTDAKFSAGSTKLTIGNIGYGNLTSLQLSFDGDQTVLFGGELDPALEPGQQFVMSVPFDARESDSLTLHYVKRTMQSPEGLRTVSINDAVLDAAAPVDSALQTVDSPATLGGSAQKDTPAPAFAIIGALAAFALVRRRSV